MLNPAPLESARFGLRVYRANLAHPDTEQLFEELVAKRVDLAIVRTPARIPSVLQPIEARGLQTIHADTLVSYECRLSDYQPKPRCHPEIHIKQAESGDRDGILELIQSVFAEYPNHYRANPLLPADATTAGYGEWALAHIHGDGKISWIARVGNRIAALACSSFDATGLCQGVLHGVHPDFAGSGIYTDLIRHTQHYFRDLGCHTLSIQTQVGNLPVQRVWVREGFTFSEVFDTFHINALLDTERSGNSRAAMPWPATQNNTPISREKVIHGFLSTALRLSGWDPLARDRIPGISHLAFWSLPDQGSDCEVRVRVYPITTDNEIVCATLHDAGSKPCALARFNALASCNPRSHYRGTSS